MKRIIAIQQQLSIGKSNEGDGGRFKYRTAEEIIERLKPLLKEQNLAVTLSDKVQEIGGRVFLVATATLWGVDGACMETTGVAELDKHLNKYDKQSMSNEQCTGSASSYARKYALCGMFAIDNAEEDPDAIPQEKPLHQRIAEAKTEDEINALMPEIKNADEKYKKAFNYQVKTLGLVFDKEAKKYINNQNKK